MKHCVLIRSAYGPSWDLEANARRLAMTEGVTIRSLRSQSRQGFRVLVLVHRDDALLSERMRAFGAIGAEFLYLAATGTSAEVAWQGYHAGWAEAIGSRDELVAMTRLDDDDAFAPWAVERIQGAAKAVQQRTVLVFPLGVRVYAGSYTLVRHDSNAMHTLVTMPGDAMTVYDYGHRKLRRAGQVRRLDKRPAWLWSRHADTISGWRLADRPLDSFIRPMFDVDWTLFGEPIRQPRQRFALAGRVFR